MPALINRQTKPLTADKIVKLPKNIDQVFWGSILTQHYGYSFDAGGKGQDVFKATSSLSPSKAMSMSFFASQQIY